MIFERKLILRVERRELLEQTRRKKINCGKMEFFFLRPQPPLKKRKRKRETGQVQVEFFLVHVTQV